MSASASAESRRPGGARRRRERGDSRQRSSRSLRAVALLYVLALLLGPVAMVFYKTFEHGLQPVWEAISEPYGVHALLLSLELVAIAVPLNTIFGVGVALLIVRKRFRGRALLGMLIDLPFALSPVVIGLSLLLVYGKTGWFGNWLAGHGVSVIFSVPGMVLATAFVSLPFVARETIPVLEEVGSEAEQAAATLGAGAWYTFRRITLPAVRWGIVYGVVLTTARVLGEFGALSVVSGNLEGETQTLTLLIEDRYNNFDLTGAYTAAFLLALLAILALIAMSLLARRGGVRDQNRAAGIAGPAAMPDAAGLEVGA
jgi:sulfate transport system permease protein